MTTHNGRATRLPTEAELAAINAPSLEKIAHRSADASAIARRRVVADMSGIGLFIFERDKNRKLNRDFAGLRAWFWWWMWGDGRFTVQQVADATGSDWVTVKEAIDRLEASIQRHAEMMKK